MSKNTLKCKGCGNVIDPDVCHCGESIVGNRPHDNHFPIPMGCDCHRAPAKCFRAAADGIRISKAVRILCRSIGCKCERDPVCVRCNAGIYDAEFCEGGWFDPLFSAWWGLRRWLRKLGPKRCDVCGKKYRQGYDENTCSAECFDEWLPF